MINGAHVVLYSTDPESDRAFFRDVLQFPSVDVGDGWLILGLPPAEAAFHPSEKAEHHEFYLMSDDIGAFVAQMEESGVSCDPVRDQGWGLLTHIQLPSGARVGVYEPRHARPNAPATS